MSESQRAFITEDEKDLVLLRKSGYSFFAISSKYGITEEQARRTYSSVLKKIKKLNKNLSYESCESDICPCGTVSEFLDYLGVAEKLKGRQELAEAIKFSYEHPEMLNQMNKRFFPELSLRLGKPVVTVEGRVRRVLGHVFANKNNLGTPVNVFFRLANLQNRHDIRLKAFFSTAWECIRELKET
ncbi:MAG: sporulation initiation factor Spo0A C-terminal domain-containing protein [Lacrimispora sp.]